MGVRSGLKDIAAGRLVAPFGRMPTCKIAGIQKKPLRKIKMHQLVIE
jgi:hypothetical protein